MVNVNIDTILNFWLLLKSFKKEVFPEGKANPTEQVHSELQPDSEHSAVRLRPAVPHMQFID